MYPRARRARMFLEGRLQMIVRARLFIVSVALAFIVPGVADAQIAASDAKHHTDPVRQYDGLPVSLPALLEEALDKNPDLAALRQQIAVARQRPNQERGLNPPMAEATIWQWPINTLNPANTNMY